MKEQPPKLSSPAITPNPFMDPELLTHEMAKGVASRQWWRGRETEMMPFYSSSPNLPTIIEPNLQFQSCPTFAILTIFPQTKHTLDSNGKASSSFTERHNVGDPEGEALLYLTETVERATVLCEYRLFPDVSIPSLQLSSLHSPSFTPPRLCHTTPPRNCILLHRRRRLICHQSPPRVRNHSRLVSGRWRGPQVQHGDIRESCGWLPPGTLGNEPTLPNACFPWGALFLLANRAHLLVCLSSCPLWDRA